MTTPTPDRETAEGPTTGLVERLRAAAEAEFEDGDPTGRGEWLAALLPTAGDEGGERCPLHHLRGCSCPAKRPAPTPPVEGARPEVAGPNPYRSLTGTVCDKNHGAPDNTALFYGHGGRSDVCIRVGQNWYFDVKERRDG